MNTINTINTANTANTANMNNTTTATETQQTAAVSKISWMTGVAGLLFWTTVVLQFLMIWHDMIDYEFANHVIYHILPLTGVLAYFGLKRDLTAIAERKDKCDQAPNSDC